MKWLILVVSGILGFLPNIAYSQDFHCLPGATESPPYKPGTVVRWCQIEKENRLLYHGSVWRWYPSGQMEGKEFYVLGAAEGLWPSWYENGKPSSIGRLRDRSKVGLWKYWNEDGTLTSEVTYTTTGNAWTEYYPSGKRKAEGRSVTSGKVGRWTYWDEAGKQKATCDFDGGLFSITTAPCQLIAEELEPIGFSRPIPLAKFADNGGVTLSVASQTYNFHVPSNWIANAEKDDEVPIALYPKGGAWHEYSSPNMYVQVLFTEGRAFERVVKDEADRFREGVENYSEKINRPMLKNGETAISKTISYKPVVSTDSPFGIVANNTIYELVDYVKLSDDVVLLVTLACYSKVQLEKQAPAFRILVDSLH